MRQSSHSESSSSPTDAFITTIGQKRMGETAGLDDSSENPSKRPRIHDVLRSPSTVTATRLFPDKTYYFPDGDLTLYARDIIFKVHSVILAQDGSCFQSRLKRRNEEGGDQIPMEYMLSDESPRQFRQLLWALYAPAFETTPATQPHNLKLDKMLDISHASHKYGFPSMVTWALNAVYDFFLHMPLDGSDFLDIGTPRLERVIIHANRHGHTELLALISRQWMSLVLAGTVCLKDGLDLAERCSLRSLRGLIYYHTLIKGREFWSAEASLSFQRRTNLLSGFERLVVQWDAIKTSLLASDSDSSSCEQCPNTNGLPLWARVLPAADQCGTTDILGKLDAIIVALGCLRAEDPPLRCCDCINRAQTDILHRVTVLEDNLSDLFAN